MARHNRLGRGTDQRGSDYAVSYQPDWLEQVKVTRTLENGRQSTKTLFRNPERSGRRPGPKVRTRIVSRKENLDIEIGVSDPSGVVTRIIVETSRPDRSSIQFTLDDRKARRRARKATAAAQS
ncbi:MAG: hypothetical protein A2W29_03680 [Gemmatimonadetes bacterium RBG_16_66_8]|nr:MAG: hypothetical protein A2W29_03680 [Gemmatimonadetes bacterium RBG_16_66_8]